MHEALGRKLKQRSVKPTGVMAQWLGCLPHNQKVVGSSPGRVIPKTLKMVLTAFSSGDR